MVAATWRTAADSATDASVGRVYVAAQELLDEIIGD
jgi:hypothetical protein